MFIFFILKFNSKNYLLNFKQHNSLSDTWKMFKNFPCIAIIFPVLHLNSLYFPCLESLHPNCLSCGHPVLTLLQLNKFKIYLYYLLFMEDSLLFPQWIATRSVFQNFTAGFPIHVIGNTLNEDSYIFNHI